MFVPVLEPKPRGFTGRPLIALVFAIAMGSLGSDLLGSWLHLEGLPALGILAAIILIVHYVWYWADRSSHWRG
jgi:hypothetical protein